jgi:hypothetical protein
MENETRYIVSDMLDVIERLAVIVRDLNPGADYSFIDFLLDRADRTLENVRGTES